MFHAAADAILDVETRDFAVLDDVHAATICAARIAPGHRIMPHRAAATLDQPAP